MTTKPDKFWFTIFRKAGRFQIAKYEIKDNKMEKIKLSDGNIIPVLGYGTYKIQECPQGAGYCIDEALKAGYRHFDGADAYENEALVGEALYQAIKDKRVRREDLFITSKVPQSKQGYESTIQCCLKSLEKMHLDYFDLYLIHDPNRASENWKSYVIDTWRALEHLVQEGKVKSIGVSNFGIKHL